jgi:type VI secretion system protein ImpF
MPKVIPASYAPLFDRLTGLSQDAVDDALLDSSRLKDSLARELLRLFNTTSALTLDRYLDSDLTVLDYGLPDFRTLSVQSATDLDRLARVIEKALRCFEPRLSRVSVQVRARPGSNTGADVALVAAVRLGHELRRVDFALALGHGEPAQLLA